MTKTVELQSLTLDQLSTTTGGDAGGSWWNNNKKNFHDWRMRAGQVATDVATRNVKGAGKNLLLSYVDAMHMYREGAAPWTANLGVKP